MQNVYILLATDVSSLLDQLRAISIPHDLLETICGRNYQIMVR